MWFCPRKKPIRERFKAHKNFLMARPRRPKLGVYCKESKRIEFFLHSNHFRFPPTVELVTDLVKDPET
jgi:hypothetical protein